MAKIKARNFTFILYPESLPGDWVTKLERIGIPMAVSPIHDVDPRKVKELSELKDDELELYKVGKLYKKPHYHVMYAAPNPVTVDGVRRKVQRALGEKTISHVEIVDSIEGYYAYLTHESKDAKAKNKPVYDKANIKLLNNFDIDRYITLDDAQKKELFDAITEAIIKYQIANIIDLSEFIKVRGAEIGVPNIKTMNDVIAPRTGLLRLYLDGAYQRNQQGRKGFSIAEKNDE